MPCDKRDRPWGYYSKWNKSDRERWTPYDSLVWNIKKQNKWTRQTKQKDRNKHIGTENRVAVARGISVGSAERNGSRGWTVWWQRTLNFQQWAHCTVYRSKIIRYM